MLGQHFFPKQKNTDKARHKDASVKDQVINGRAARVAPIDDEGRKHADEYAQLLDSVHGRPLILLSVFRHYRLVTVGPSLRGQCPNGTPAVINLTIVKHAGALRR